MAPLAPSYTITTTWQSLCYTSCATQRLYVVNSKNLPCLLYTCLLLDANDKVLFICMVIHACHVMNVINMLVLIMVTILLLLPALILATTDGADV